MIHKTIFFVNKMIKCKVEQLATEWKRSEKQFFDEFKKKVYKSYKS